MADSLKFTIGGQLGPSYRGALAQAEAEALKANSSLQAKIRSQQLRLQALDKAYNSASGAEAAAIAIQQYPKRLAMERELQQMQLKFNLIQSAAVRKTEAEKLAAIAKADAEQVALNRAKTEAIIAQEAEAAAAEVAMWDAAKNAELADEAEKATARKMNTGVIRETLALFREIAAGRGIGRIAATGTLLAQQAWKGLAAVLFSIPGLVAAAAAAIAYFSFKAINGIVERAKNLADLLDPLKKKFTDLAEGERQNAKAHQEYLDWLKKIGDEAESLPEKIDKIIKRMREQAAAELELARVKGASKMAIERMEEDQLKRELQIVTLGKLQAQREYEQAMIAADAADKAQQATKPSELKEVQRAAENAGAILDAAQDALKEHPTSMRVNTKSMSLIPGIINRPNTSATPLDLEVQGKKIKVSVDDAKASFDRLTLAANKLEDIQKNAADTAANTKMTAEEKKKQADQLAEQQADILAQLGIKQTTGRKIAAFNEPHSGGVDSGLDKSGIFSSAGAVRMHTILEESLRVQKSIEKNTRNTGSGIHTRGVAYD